MNLKSDFKKLDKILKMTPAQANEKLMAFILFMKEDMPKVKKILFCFCLAAVLVVSVTQADLILQTVIKTTIEKRDGYKNIQNFLDTYQRDAKRYKEEIVKIKGKILDEASIEKSALFVQKTADSNDVAIVSTSRTNKSTPIGAGIESIAIRLSLKGTYASIMKMVKEMEDASFFINIEKVTFKPASTKAGEKEIIAEVEYLIFFDKGAGKEESKGGAKT